MRTEKELIKIALDNFDNIYNKNLGGLCYYFYILNKKFLIDFQESEKLINIIKKYSVSYRKYFIFYDKRRIMDKFATKSGYFWKKNEEGTLKRKQYLEYLYEKL